MSRLKVLGAATLLGLAACQPTETPEQMQARMDRESAEFTAFLSTVATRWSAWFATGQADSVANLFAEQGREMPPNGPAAVGRAAVKAVNEQTFGLGKWTLTVQPEASMANGAIGIDRGSFTTTFTANEGRAPLPGMMMPPPADSGKYLAHWHKVNGTWQVIELIWNSNLPMPAPAPARRR